MDHYKQNIFASKSHLTKSNTRKFYDNINDKNLQRFTPIIGQM